MRGPLALGGVEQALQLRWKTGVKADWSELPILRLPIPENPNAIPFQAADFTALIGQAGEQVRGIYEADYRDFNRETYARGRETFDATWAGARKMLRLLSSLTPMRTAPSRWWKCRPSTLP